METQFFMKLVTPLPVLGEIETYKDNREQISSLDFLPTCKTAESASDKILSKLVAVMLKVRI